MGRDGTDTFIGGTGNDIYIGRGSGQDSIWDYDKTTGNFDTILLTDDITPEDIRSERKGDDLDLSAVGTSDKLTIRNYFCNDSTDYRVEQVQFADGPIRAALPDAFTCLALSIRNCYAYTLNISEPACCQALRNSFSGIRVIGTHSAGQTP